MVSFALLLLGLASISQCCVVPFTGDFSLRQDYCKQVQPGEKPYQISVATSSYVHLCSGALITFSFAITAARCIFNYKPSDIYVVAGTVVLEGGSSSWINYVNEIITPQEYNISKPCLNDIALLALSGYFPSINTIGIVSLPTLFVSQNEFNKVKSAVFTVSGYEKVEYRNLPDYRYYFGVYNQYLLFKDDEHILTSSNNCTYYWRIHCFISQTQICTYHGSTKSEENQINIRDEGALLVYNGTLFGIASCANDYYYNKCLYSKQLSNVFTDITLYVFWIQSEISARRARQTTS